MASEKINWISTILALGIVAMGILLVIFQTNGTELSDQKTLNVAGDAKMEVTPDMAKVYIGITTLNKDAKVSQSDNQKTTNKVIEALEKMGIKVDMIETSSYTLQQKYEYNNNLQKSEFVGYETVEILQITTEDVTGVGDIIDTSISSGANGVNSVSFELKKATKDSVTKDLLGQASVVAKAKADALASSLKIEVGEVKSVSESINIPIYSKAGFDTAGAIATQILPQTVEVTASVMVSYEINE
jgi:uncharacterized protein